MDRNVIRLGEGQVSVVMGPEQCCACWYSKLWYNIVIEANRVSRLSVEAGGRRGLGCRGRIVFASYCTTCSEAIKPLALP